MEQRINFDKFNSRYIVVVDLSMQRFLDIRALGSVRFDIFNLNNTKP